jgi:hypothetical protein
MYCFWAEDAGYVAYVYAFDQLKNINIVILRYTPRWWFHDLHFSCRK